MLAEQAEKTSIVGNDDSKLYIGIDNGVTGSICVLRPLGSDGNVYRVPTIFGQDYTLKKQNVSRLDCLAFSQLLSELPDIPKIVVIENPLCTPKFFQNTMIAMRCYEAQLIVLEMLKIGHRNIPPSYWQKELLPSGMGRRPKESELKKVSTDIGKKLFPHWSDFIDKQGDADAILIAEYARRNRL